MDTRMTKLAPLAAAAGLALLACRGGEADGEGLAGRITADGSSTVYPITQAMAEEFGIENPGVQVTVGISGTGGGFKRFCAGETDISDASREIKESESEQCRAAGIEPIEIPVAWDGLTVVVNPANDWAACMTVEELRRVWQPESTIRRWNQVREDWPDRELKLYGPDTDSGTFDYFTEAIVGEEDASRSDYTASADDNVLVMGVAGDADALGYFGFAYYEENEGRLKAVAVDGGSGCVEPTRETVEGQTYTPLSRPIYIYVRQDALERAEVQAFVRYYLEKAPSLVPEAGYIPLDLQQYQGSLERLRLAAGGEAAAEAAGTEAAGGDTAEAGTDTAGG